MPDWERYVRDRLTRLTVTPERENEIVAEVALQLEQAYSAALSRGESEQAALEIAQSQVRSWEAMEAQINSAEHYAAPPSDRPNLVTGAAADVRHALRFFRRSPAFTAIAVLTLALGIGGNTAIFTLVDAVALRGLPYRDPSRLMAIETRKVGQPEVEPWTRSEERR